MDGWLEEQKRAEKKVAVITCLYSNGNDKDGLVCVPDCYFLSLSQERMMLGQFFSAHYSSKKKTYREGRWAEGKSEAMNLTNFLADYYLFFFFLFSKLAAQLEEKKLASGGKK